MQPYLASYRLLKQVQFAWLDSHIIQTSATFTIHKDYRFLGGDINIEYDCLHAFYTFIV